MYKTLGLIPRTIENRRGGGHPAWGGGSRKNNIAKPSLALALSPRPAWASQDPAWKQNTEKEEGRDLEVPREAEVWQVLERG